MGGGTELGKVRGLGASKEGTHHWIVQRYTAVGNLLLVTWLVISLAMLPALDHWVVVGWLQKPLVAVPMMLLIVSVFNHLRLGLQVFIEDYVHEDGLKFAVIMLVNFFAIGAGTLGIFSVAKIAFSGAV